jgi:hypothetical protein
MQDIILRLYEFYERYHNIKEKMAWLGISFYAVFTLGIIRIFTINDLSIDPWLLWVTIGVLTVVMGCILWFLCFHYKKKRCAAKIVFDYLFLSVVFNRKYFQICNTLNWWDL